MNNITIIGNLTKDPELYEGKETNIATLSVAVNRPRNSEETDYFIVKAFGATADNCQEFLTKGKKVAVSGAMQMRKYEDEDDNTRVVWELVASRVEFLSPKDSEEKSSKKSSASKKKK